MKRVLLKVGASALALSLMAACGTDDNDNGPADDNPTIDHEERQDEFNDEENDQMDGNDTNDTNDMNDGNDLNDDLNDDDRPRDDR